MYTQRCSRRIYNYTARVKEIFFFGKTVNVQYTWSWKPCGVYHTKYLRAVLVCISHILMLCDVHCTFIIYNINEMLILYYIGIRIYYIQYHRPSLQRLQRRDDNIILYKRNDTSPGQLYNTPDR